MKTNFCLHKFLPISLFESGKLKRYVEITEGLVYICMSSNVYPNGIMSFLVCKIRTYVLYRVNSYM